MQSFAGLYRFSQRLAWANEVALPYYVIQTIRAHPRCQRHLRGKPACKQILLRHLNSGVSQNKSKGSRNRWLSRRSTSSVRVKLMICPALSVSANRHSGVSGRYSMDNRGIGALGS